ncbi:hypothetical protein Cyast_2074 [Cyanobacterium stanieri PCC 7202]|uniref:DUF2459 domain-containing protein n=1 Tax=Cyanobacterium stanieri (strain ATCC 29140 / PCC 7202) TaxID=292563 RepID=K9YMC5_CYASC|nr:hypothetical protein Cyast_2074 [Cyanobacterium stanieri PCC 7202]
MPKETRKPIFRRRTILLIATIFIVVKLSTLIFSNTIIIPPTSPLKPITVYVIDYGLHSRLILPDRPPTLVQYAYGDWEYFALQNRNLLTTLKALLIPTQGTLKREEISNLATLKKTVNAQPRINLLELEVSEEKMLKLRSKLEQRFEENIDTKITYNADRIQFVKDDQEYTILHNSNHQVVEWLQAMGCEVKGIIFLPNFELVSHSKNKALNHT